MSGRKPLPSNQRRVPLTVFIAPETNQKLRQYSAREGYSLGQFLDQAVRSWELIDLEDQKSKQEWDQMKGTA